MGTGRTVVNNKNNPIKQYEPYFSATAEYEDDPALVTMGVTPYLRYDALDRLVRVDHPDGSHERVALSAWSQTAYDRNDTVDDGGDHPWYEAMSAGDTQEQATADKALAHAGTPTVTHLDALGRPFLVVEHNGGAEYHATKTVLDVDGQVLSVVDPLGRTCMTLTYGMLGQVLKLDSLDAGARWRFDAVNGQPVKSWGERGASSSEPYAQRVVYDELRRPTEVWLNDDGTEVQVQALVYGEGHMDVVSNNLRGRLVEHRDQSGVVKDNPHRG